ncbi:MAG: DAK2 domain-containing protein [Eubacterium sp.]|nr:DAK2 domain-containing protein [Eubacterium sp.]
MTVKTMDALLVKKCFLAGAAAIQAKKEYINDLNVFPVPDGDTGTNMTMTIMSAANEVLAIEDPDMETICRAISSGSLRGARGNSGVILSQLLRGFTKVIRNEKEINVKILVQSFQKAVDSAYKAVMKPKEGTILTVAKGGAEHAYKIAKNCDDIVEFARQVIEQMRVVLARTPDMLPVLKEAGVVDSGGEGLVTILEGVYDALTGKEVHYEAEGGTPAIKNTSNGANVDGISTGDIKFGYCTEFIILLEKEFTSRDEKSLKGYLESIGDSIVCVADEELVKIHVHTNDPGLAIQKGLTYGELSRMKIDNMREEHNERLIQSAGAPGAMPEATPKVREKKEAETPWKKVGFISVSVGEGLGNIFRELGADYVIEGGQTMNPSTEDILGAISQVRAETIYIFPNNSNIVLAANQAKDLTEDKHIVVIPTKNIPQGITAMINYIDGNSAEENEAAMTEAVQQIRSGQVTYAVRDTSIDGKEIKQGDIMGLSDKTIEVVGGDVKETTLLLIDALKDEETELVTLYYGAESSEEEAQEIAAAVCEKYEEIEVEVEYGGQPIYYYFISVE